MNSSHGSRVPRSSRLPVEQVPVSTTQWRAATVGRRARAVRDRRWWLGGRISRGRRPRDRVRAGCTCFDQTGGFCHCEWPSAYVSERREKAKGRVRRRRGIEIAGASGTATGVEAVEAGLLVWLLRARWRVGSATRRLVRLFGSPAQWQTPRMWICVGTRDRATEPSRGWLRVGGSKLPLLTTLPKDSRSPCVDATSDKSGSGGCGLVGIRRRFPKCHHARHFFASPATSAPCSSQPQPYTPGASSSRPLAWFYLHIFLKKKVSRGFCVGTEVHTQKKRCVRYQQRFALNQLPRPPRGWDGGLRHEKGSEGNVILWCGASFVAIYAGRLQITFYLKPAVACFTRRKNTLGAGRDAPRDDGWRDTKAGGGEHGTR